MGRAASFGFMCILYLQERQPAAVAKTGLAEMALDAAK